MNAPEDLRVAQSHAVPKKRTGIHTAQGLSG